MTTRETMISKKILQYLHELDGGQAHALTIHAHIGGMTVCGAAEFDSVLSLLDARHYVIGISTKFKGPRWNISDAGEAALLEM